ncbi:MAG: hypothetical protein PHQ70_08395 [Arcobacter sp.]|uniref:hypothetical protein n=1 Tax=Arcobacter sp. TaxID=1872629 RepID=UPI00258ED57B|nr:hypothetical protein [Arcobacter sp.]MDD3008871.1 hypothetical protein [Arcobacter sp.]
MAAKSKLEKFKKEISDLIEKGVSVSSAHKIINSSLSDEAKISYNAFLHFVNKHIKDTNG